MDVNQVEIRSSILIRPQRLIKSSVDVAQSTTRNHTVEVVSLCDWQVDVSEATSLNLDLLARLNRIHTE